jgi:PAS domain S-box-containing protein
MAAPEPKRLLIVDDDPGLLRLIQKILLREGFSCKTASSGSGALKLLENSPVDLLLLDLKLQDTNAVDFMDKLVSNGLQIPFVIITGQGDERVAVDMMKRGALDYVVKDANFIEFLPTVVTHAISQIERENRLSLAEIAVQESERRFRETLDGMMEGCQTLGFDWHYLYVNEAAARHGRRRMDELLGRTIMEVYPGIEKTTLFSKLSECMEKRTRCNLENEFHYGDGESAWFQLSVQPVPEDLFILSLDVTKRKEAERYRKLQYDAATILSENDSLSELLLRTLEQICRTFGWQTGEFWMVDEASNLLRLIRVWPSEGTSHLWEEFARKQTMDLASGVPGRAWKSARPAFVTNLASDDNCARKELAQKLGMHSAFAFPVAGRGEVLGVLVFFGTQTRCPDEDGLSCFAAIARELFQFVERKKLEREILEISHKEQNRLGRDLHDGLGQQLTALEFFTVNLAAEADAKSPPLGKKIRKMGEHLRDAIKQTRAMANGLSPISLNEGGLPTALDKLAEAICAMAKVDCKFIYPAALEIAEEPGIHLYRIAQETTNNSLKHGRAKKIRISLSKRGDGQLQLAILDNGRGFSTLENKSSGMGLRVMKYRASLIGAELSIQSEPGAGTRITCVMRKFV